MGNKRKKSEKQQQNGWIADPMAVTWTENYNDVISKYWNKVPYSLGKTLATLAVFIVGVSINGK